MKPEYKFAILLEKFFTDRLMRQRRVSPHTIASYRDTFRLLLLYLKCHLNKQPSKVSLSDINAKVIIDFLNYLEKCRGNKPRSRNIRLAAIRSFYRYIAFEEPDKAELIQNVLSIPCKRWHRRLVSFLTPNEIDTVLKAINTNTKFGRRDYILILLASQTGLRVSEMIGLKYKDVVFGKSVSFRQGCMNDFLVGGIIQAVS